MKTKKRRNGIFWVIIFLVNLWVKMKKTYSQCQSCGMPLKKDLKWGGLEIDWTLSKIYCSSCYEYGAFKSPNISLQEM